MCPKLYRLMITAAYATPVINLSTSWQQLVGGDQNRLRMVLNSNSTGIVHVAFGQSLPPAAMISVPTSSVPQILRVEEFGELLTEPIWVLGGAAIANFRGITIISGQPLAIKDFYDGH